MNNIDKRIDTYFDEYISSLKGEEKIIESIKYSFLEGGKHIRFKLYAALLFDLEINYNDYIQPGIAIEMIHTYSLIHDDLPAMDNDDFRRGKMSNHKVYGEDVAILAGDALLTHAFEILIKTNISADIKVELINALCNNAGVNSGMINGQVLDITNENNPNIDLNTINKIHHEKTAKLIFLPLKFAMIVGKYNGELDFEKFANDLGMYYQIQDDYLDLYGTYEELGKKTSSDRDQGKKTYVDFYSKEELENLLENMGNEILNSIVEFKELSKIVRKILKRNG